MNAPLSAKDHLRTAGEHMRAAISEIHAASIRSPRFWRSELLHLHRKLLGLASEIVEALAQIV